MFVLAVPWLLLLLLFLIVICLIKKKWLISLCGLLICFILNWNYECVPFNILHFLHSENNDSRTCLKFVSFNVDGLSGSSEDIEARIPKILDALIKDTPDIVFVAEFPEWNFYSLDTLLKKHFQYSVGSRGHAQYFYSRYPLEGFEILTDGNKIVGVYKSSVTVNSDTIVLYGCHFASNNYTADRQYITPDSINSSNDIKAYIRDIDLAYNQRGREAQVLVDDMSHDKKVLVMGDFNDVGGSKALRTLENAGLRDAWWEGGFGYGATIHKPLPYRIDHFMYSSELNIRNIKVISSNGLSDHDALYVEIEI